MKAQQFTAAGWGQPPEMMMRNSAVPSMVGFDEPKSRISAGFLAPPLKSSSRPAAAASKRYALRFSGAFVEEVVRHTRRLSGRKMLLAGACFLAAVYFLAPRLFFTYSERAVTNAPLITLRSPFPGRVETTAYVGQRVVPGDTLGTIANPVWDPSPMLDVEQRLRAAEARVEATQKEIAGLKEIRERLEQDYAIWHQLIAKSADLYITQAQRRLVAAQARSRAAETNLLRYDRLATFQLVNLQRLTDIKRDHQVAKDEVTAAEAEVGRAQQQRAAIEAGITIGENDRPPSLQRMDEIDIRLTTAGAALKAAQGDVQMLERQRSERIEQRERETRIPVRSTVNGTVWRVFARPGEDVSPRSEVLSVVDCDHVGVSAIFNQRHVNKLRPGREVSLQLVGINRPLQGRIAWVNGYYRADDRQAEAIAVKPDDDGSVITWITLDETLPSCWVGLKATVHLD